MLRRLLATVLSLIFSAAAMARPLAEDVYGEEGSSTPPAEWGWYIWAHIALILILLVVLPEKWGKWAVGVLFWIPFFVLVIWDTVAGALRTS
jgi:hypothetical protein